MGSDGESGDDYTGRRRSSDKTCHTQQIKFLKIFCF